MTGQREELIKGSMNLDVSFVKAQMCFPQNFNFNFSKVTVGLSFTCTHAHNMTRI